MLSESVGSDVGVGRSQERAVAPLVLRVRCVGTKDPPSNKKSTGYVLPACSRVNLREEKEWARSVANKRILVTLGVGGVFDFQPYLALGSFYFCLLSPMDDERYILNGLRISGAVT